LEVEEGAKDIDVEGVDPITKLLDYIPSRKGKAKVTEDPNSEKFVIHMPLLPEKIALEGLYLAWVSLLKMEYWDLANLRGSPTSQRRII